MVQPRRRVSYIIPPPIDSVPRLQLPPHGISRLGSIGPLLLPSKGHVEQPKEEVLKSARHPRHRLGVASLALDTSTQLNGRKTPEGILYSGGRDGLVISWDLGIPMKKRKEKEEDEEGVRRSSGRWEVMTGWGDDAIDEEGEEGDEKPASDGDVLGDVTGGSDRRRKLAIRTSSSIPYEYRWETDIDAFKAGKPSQFRQCAQTHTDWVNDILLCNYDQTVVSASSDGTIKTWNPHSPSSSDPSVIGSHHDYVRCLAHCREQNWIASGSFDRTIKLWDLSRSVTQGVADPLMTLNPPDATAPKSSVYAIAADPFGHAIASGSPERVIRMWDPRSGKRTGKLVGHTDNIRAILISEDSRYLLTGSADASVKLWSLASQRCLHTFTHHTDSVWSLFSSHPSLEIFYSGDRSGLVCKVDVEDCPDVSEGECIVLCQDSGERGISSSEGINKIVAMDDNLLWTASGSSSIKRWRVPQRRAVRASALMLDVDTERRGVSESPVATRMRANSAEVASEPNTRPSTEHGPRRSLAPSIQSLASDNWLPQRDREDETTLYGIPFDSLVRLISPNDPFTPYTSSMARGRDPEVATLYSAASVMSVPRTNAVRSPIPTTFQHSHTSPMTSSRTEDTVHPVHAARAEYEERELAADAVPLYSVPDDIIGGDHGLVRSIILNDRMHALTVDTSGEVAVWDLVRGICRGRYFREDVAAASHRGSTTGESNNSTTKERSPREALEEVRERIEGEAVVVPWSTVSTKTGVLTVDLNEKPFEAEVYADEVGFAHDRHFTDESRLNIGKWVLRNLFLGFIREEQRSRRSRDSNNSPDGTLSPSLRRVTNHLETNGDTLRKRSSSSSDSSRRLPKPPASAIVISAPKMIPAVSPVLASPTRSSPLLTPMIPLYSIGKDNNIPLPSIPQSPFVSSNDTTPMPRRLRSGTLESNQPPPSAMPKEGDYFSVRTRQASIPGGVPPNPDDPLGWAGLGKAEPGAQTPSTPGGLMGRLKTFGGKISTKRPAGDIGASSPVLGSAPTALEAAAASEEVTPPEPAVTKTPLEVLLSNPLNPPPSSEAPSHHHLPQNIALLISEEASPGWTTIYRGTVSSAYHDTRVLEEAMPMWLLEYLLMNKSPDVPITKLSFVLLPWPNKDPDAEQLPELLNTTQSKLTASRFLRVRKLVIHVQDKLEKMASTASSTRSSLEGQSPTSSKSPRPKAEDSYEILCNDVLLPLDMTLAAVRQYVWRQAGELTMHYRRKSPP